MASKLNTSIIAKIFILRTATLAKERYPAIKGFQWKFSYKNIRSEPCPWKNTYIHIHIYILVYSVFCIERRGRVTESCHDDIYMHVNYLPTWNLKPRITKNTCSVFVCPSQRKRRPLKPRWLELRRTFKNIKMDINSGIEQCRNWATREWQRDGEDWARNPQTQA